MDKNGNRRNGLHAFARALTGALIIFGSSFMHTQPGTAAEPLVRADFSAFQEGKCSDDMLRAYWKGLVWVNEKAFDERVRIVSDDGLTQGKALRVTYPKGTLMPDKGGAQFYAALPPAEEYWLTYQVKFEKGFDFYPTGKLPGLTSGGFSGGRKPTKGEGWSTRYMFKRGGKAIVYFYHVGMEGKWGDNLWLESVTFTPGVWHRLTQHIKLNSADNQKNGVMEVWFDGKRVLSRTDVLYRLGNQGLIDSFYFSTFHGGNAENVGPKETCYARFADFEISTAAPAYLSEKSVDRDKDKP